jgi:murein peptide amidase A
VRRVELLAALTVPRWETVGASVSGRPLVARCFPGARPELPPALIFGAIHGNEPLGAFLVARLADELDAAAAPPTRTAWLLPVANPDGFLADRKDNARGVDLNRNFPAASWNRVGPTGYDPGESPGSEPETRALMALIDRAGATRLVALHSPFRTVNFDGPARALAERMAAWNGYGASEDIGYPTPGSFGSCYGRDRQLEVITLEIPPMTAEQAWEENARALQEVLCQV